MCPPQPPHAPVPAPTPVTPPVPDRDTPTPLRPESGGCLQRWIDLNA